MSGQVVVRRGRPGYPGRLLELHDPPAALHCIGRLGLLDWTGPVLGTVGSRTAGEPGLALARRLCRAAAAAGALVVSGLALGIDAAAHDGALDAGEPTVAVLGCGADVAYPPRNRALYRRVTEEGLVVSEYPAGTEPAPWRFPARNRLIAALADVVLVVEARRRSGALITADHALDLGRDVLAVPGWPGFAGSAGVNALLKAGAGLIEDEVDLLGWLGLAAAAGPAPAAPDPQAGRVLDALRRGPAHPDQLATVLAMDAGPVSAAIARLELAGLVVRDESGCWIPLLGRGGGDAEPFLPPW